MSTQIKFYARSYRRYVITRLLYAGGTLFVISIDASVFPQTYKARVRQLRCHTDDAESKFENISILNYYLDWRENHTVCQ